MSENSVQMTDAGHGSMKGTTSMRQHLREYFKRKGGTSGGGWPHQRRRRAAEAEAAKKKAQ